MSTHEDDTPEQQAHWYECQEAAFAPGCAVGWPRVIPAPHTRNGRLVRRDGDPTAKIAALESANAELRDRCSKYGSEYTDLAKRYAELRRECEGHREALATYAHEAWSGWMKYLFSKCGSVADSNVRLFIPRWAVERWRRQSDTAYVDLPEEEKESDRAEADKMLAIMALPDAANGDKE